MKSRLVLSILLLLLLCSQLGSSKKLIFMQELFRHGARYPLHNLNDYSDFMDKQKLKGELTSQGKHMQYILGKIMYEQYWKQLFAGTEYIDRYHPSIIYVKSTNVNRTIESAESQLLGLLQTLPPYELLQTEVDHSLPPYYKANEYHEQLSQNSTNSTSFDVYGKVQTYFHTVPIHMEKEIDVPKDASYKYRANPYDQADFLSKYEPVNCPNQNFWARENMLSEQAMKIKNSQQVKQFLAALSSEVGKQIKYEQAVYYVDNYYCQLFLGKKHLNLFNNLQNVKTGNFIMLSSTILSWFFTEDQIKTSNTRLFQATIQNMKNAIAGKGPKLVLYSAHDTTVLSFNAALELFNLNCVMDYYFKHVDNKDSCLNQYPPFATNIIVELWQEDNLSHSIRLLYNGQERILPTCGNKVYCPFSQFQQWAKDFYIDDPNDTCGIREQYTKLYIVIGVLSIFIVIFIIAEMRSRFKKKLQAKLHEMEQKKGYIQNFEQKQSQGHSEKHNT